MENNYTYPVIADYSGKDVIDLYFPDFPNLATCVDDDKEIVTAAQDVLALTIRDYEECGNALPEPSVAVELKKDQRLIYVNIWMPYHRSKIKEVYVKKTLTIPEWLNILGMQNNLNFSAILADGIKTKLGIKNEE